MSTPTTTAAASHRSAWEARGLSPAAWDAFVECLLAADALDAAASDDAKRHRAENMHRVVDEWSETCAAAAAAAENKAKAADDNTDSDKATPRAQQDYMVKFVFSTRGVGVSCGQCFVGLSFSRDRDNYPKPKPKAHVA